MDGNHSWRTCSKPPTVANQTLSWIHLDNSPSWDSWCPTLCPDPNEVLREHDHVINFFILLDSSVLVLYSLRHQTFPAPFLSLSVSCSSFCLTIQFSAYPSLPAGTLALCWEKPCPKEIPELSMVFAALQTKIVTSAKQCTSSFTQPFKFSYSARAE